jgi:hypothetical protein
MDHQQYDEEEGQENPPEEADENEETPPGDGYGTRRVRRRTNWQYRADSLRRTHIRILNEVHAFVELALGQAVMLLAAGHMILSFAQMHGRSI